MAGAQCRKVPLHSHGNSDRTSGVFSLSNTLLHFVQDVHYLLTGIIICIRHNQGPDIQCIFENRAALTVTLGIHYTVTLNVVEKENHALTQQITEHSISNIKRPVQ